jgi:hypothetical protein
VKRFAVVLLVALAACSGGGGKPHTTASKTSTTPPLHALKDLGAGKHFGFVTALDPTRNRLVFDEAELLTGDAAVKAAADDGGDITSGGSYVRNPDDRMNNITIDADVTIRLLTPCCELHEVSFEKWLSNFDPPDTRTFYGTTKSHYEITVDDGKVTAIEEIVVK